MMPPTVILKYCTARVGRKEHLCFLVLSAECWGRGAVMRERQQVEVQAVTVVLLTGMRSGIAGMRIKALHQRWEGGGEVGRLKKKDEKDEGGWRCKAELMPR